MDDRKCEDCGGIMPPGDEADVCQECWDAEWVERERAMDAGLQEGGPSCVNWGPPHPSEMIIRR